jgi:hypothetical protein
MAKIINFRRLERLEKQMDAMDAMDAETPKLSVSREEWDKMTPGQKLSALLVDALDYKRELLELPRPGPEDLSFHNLMLRAADSIIDQVLQIEVNPLHREPSNDLDRVLEERRQKAIAEIERMKEI